MRARCAFAGVALAAALAAPVVLMTPGSARAEAGAPAAPATERELFEAANQHYFQGEYELAIRLYEELAVERHIDDPALYHNLGNACFRAGRLGWAILHYQRALRLPASDQLAQALRSNLETTRDALRDRYRSGADRSEVIYGEPGGLLYRATHVASRAALASAFVAVWLLLFGLLALRRLRPLWTGPGGAAIAVGVCVALLGGLLVGQRYTDAEWRVGVIVASGVTLREGRHQDARGVTIPEGMEVRIVEGDDAWTRVELPSRRQGWVDSGRVRGI